MFAEVHLHQCNSVGNVVATVDANNHRATAVYDALNRLVSATDPLNHHTTTQGYDGLGRLTQRQDPLGQQATY